MSQPSVVPMKKLALAALVKAIEAAVPVLKGKVKVEASRATDMVWPSLGIRLVKATFMRSQRRVVARQHRGRERKDGDEFGWGHEPLTPSRRSHGVDAATSIRARPPDRPRRRRGSG